MNNMQQLYFGNLALDPNRQRRIVYYGRVSTEHEAQLEALEKQMQWYEDQTKYHPNWTVVGKYRTPNSESLILSSLVRYAVLQEIP